METIVRPGADAQTEAVLDPLLDLEPRFGIRKSETIKSGSSDSSANKPSTPSDAERTP